MKQKRFICCSSSWRVLGRFCGKRNARNVSDGKVRVRYGAGEAHLLGAQPLEHAEIGLAALARREPLLCALKDAR